MTITLKSSPADVVGYIELTPGERLRGVRELMDMTQNDLEAASDVKQSDISAIERDKKGMGLIVARKLSGGLGVPLSRLIQESSTTAASDEDSLGFLADQLSGKSRSYIKGIIKLASRLDESEVGDAVLGERSKSGLIIKELAATARPQAKARPKTKPKAKARPKAKAKPKTKPKAKARPKAKAA
jgi:transcriptional regulator with XRE-family HTH domain